MLYVSVCAGRSASVAATVARAVTFSATLKVADEVKSAPGSVGASKFGAVWNVNTPPLVIENLLASTPPVMLYVSVCAGRSASVAATVEIEVTFSATLKVDDDVKNGALSLTGEIEIVTS